MTTRHFVTRLHPDDRVDPGKAGPQVMRHVTVNVAESPLAWLAARGMVSDAHYRAGERLRTDYERAGLAGRVTMRWDAAPPSKSRGGARAADASLARIDAHRRFHAAVEHVGPGPGALLWNRLSGVAQLLAGPSRTAPLIGFADVFARTGRGRTRA